MTARAVDRGGAGTSVAAMDARRESSRRGDAAARGERGSRSRRAVILRAGCSDESSENVTLASIARRTQVLGVVEKTDDSLFSACQETKGTQTRRAVPHEHARWGRAIFPRASRPRHTGDSPVERRAPCRSARPNGVATNAIRRGARERTCLAPFSRRVSSLESAAKRRDRGTLTTPTPPPRAYP